MNAEVRHAYDMVGGMAKKLRRLRLAKKKDREFLGSDYTGSSTTEMQSTSYHSDLTSSAYSSTTTTDSEFREGAVDEVENESDQPHPYSWSKKRQPKGEKKVAFKGYLKKFKAEYQSDMKKEMKKQMKTFQSSLLKENKKQWKKWRKKQRKYTEDSDSD